MEQTFKETLKNGAGCYEQMRPVVHYHSFKGES